jgi:hypothetical protein
VFYVQVSDAAGQADVEQFCLPAYFPQPTITNIAPPYAIPNGNSQTITVVGNGFLPDSQIQMDNAVQSTTFVSPTEVQMTLYPSAVVPFQDAKGAQWDPFDAYPIRVLTPYTTSSATATFAIDLPVPIITSAAATYFGSANTPCIPNFSCQLNLTGSGFSAFTQYQLVGTSQTISYLSTTSPTVPWTQVTSSSFFAASPGTYSIQVTNPNQPGDGSSSTTVPFQVYTWGTIVPTPTNIIENVTQGASTTSVSLAVGMAGAAGQPGLATVSGGSWLKVNGQSTASWTSPSTLSVTLDPTGLSPASYGASITLTSSQAPNTGMVVPVTLVVSSPLLITTTSLADAYAMNPYSTALQAAGGTVAGWQIQSGDLPSGLNLNSTTGAISGTPAATSANVSRSITFAVQDLLGRTATRTLGINWKPGIVVSPPSAGTPQWVVGSAIQNSPPYNFTSSGGTAPYSWSATGLPTGLSMNSAGLLNGTPAAAGSFPVVLSVVDSTGLIGSLNITLQVTQLALRIVDETFGNVPPVAPLGTVGIAYQSVFLVGSGGSQTGFKWTITGTLPPGITSAPPPGCTPPGCAIGFSGTPTQAGSFPVTLQLSDSANNQVSLNLVFSVEAQPSITSLVPASAMAGASAFTLTVNGSGFVSGAAVMWGTTALTTTFVSATQLTATVPANLVAATGAANVTVTATGGTSAGATFTIFALPAISKAFNPTSILAGGTSVVTLTLSNSNASQLTGGAFTDTLVHMSASGAVGGSCAGTTPSQLSAGSVALSFTGIAIPASGNCTLTFSVTSSTIGVQNNTSSGVTTTQTPTAGPASNTATLTVLAAPTIAKAFNPVTIQSGGSSTVTLTLANSSPTTLTGGAFTDTLANMSAVGGSVGGTCTGTAPSTLTAGQTALSFTGIAIPANSSCTVTFSVTGNTPGAQNNATSGVTTTQIPVAGTASNTATLTVLALPTIAKAFNPSTIQSGGTSVVTLTLANSSPTTLTGGAFTDALVNMTATGGGVGGTCTGTVPASLTAGQTSLSFTGIVLPASGSCTVTFSVTSNTIGANANVTSGVTTTQTPSAGTGSNSATLAVSAANSCDIRTNGTVDVSDVQLIISEALGVAPAVNDLQHDGVVNVGDVQIVINAVLGMGCSAF